MGVKVGIPRALSYYEYADMWRTFFQELGVDVIFSEPTTKSILNDGVKNCVDEACLPVKLFHGHVVDLKDRVDYIFIPRLKSVAKGEYICPKFCGLPEMIKFSIQGLPTIIDTEINMRESESALKKAFTEIGRIFTNSRADIDNAFKNSIRSYETSKVMLQRTDFGDKTVYIHKENRESKKDISIAMIGHSYNIYDSYINMSLLQKLKAQGIRLIVPEELDPSVIEQKADTLPKKMFWTYGKRLIGSVLHLLDRDDIDGIIYLTSFGCGIDAFAADICERNVRRKTNLPFFMLSLDEHSGEAGMNTRIEAFIDMIKWRKRNESHISAYG